MKDNKGQVLVTFILLIPVLFILMATIADTGLLMLEKRRVDNNIKDVIKYGVDNLSMDNLELRTKMTNILTTNIASINRLTIDIDSGIITISITKKKESLFSYILNKTDYNIESNYYGYLNNGKIIVKEV